jgi:anti-sigma regulatory factor (Ser/Thr protein kinase)
MSVADHQQTSLAITDRSCIGEARRLSCQIAARARLTDAESSPVPLIVSELATNLLLHAHGGEVLMRLLPADSGRGIEVIAVDRGPGMADVQRCIADGYSTGRTRGCGLGAVRRQSTDFHIYSNQPGGTVVLSRVLGSTEKLRRKAEFSVISVAAPNETECGDAWQVRQLDGRLYVLVADGLGHGPLAALAADEAARVFTENLYDSPVGYLEAAHSALRTSRGAAIAAVDVELGSRRLNFAGVGNIASTLVRSSGATQPLMSYNGIVGANFRKLRAFEHQWNDGDLLVMHSDGMSTRWKLTGYPGLILADTAVIAAILYRDSKRGRDDTTVLVARLKAS